MNEKLTLTKGIYEGETLKEESSGRMIPHGKGKLKTPYGDYYEYYEGDFVDGKFHGKGKLTSSELFEYEGDFVEGAFQGKGKWINLRYDDIYEGDFFKGRKHGKGKIIYADGRVYEGDWAKGRYNGKGKMTYAEPQPSAQREGSPLDGRIEEGEWKDNEFKGEVKKEE